MKMSVISNFVIFVMICLSLLLFTKSSYELVKQDDNKNSDLLLISKKGIFRNKVDFFHNRTSSCDWNCIIGIKNKRQR